jgi:hypothetical protein
VNNERRASFLRRWKPWQVILLFGLLQSAITGFGTFFDLASGIGMFFVYVVAHLNALVVVLPILLYRRFGVGTAVYLPWAISGLFVEYYLEYVLYRSLRSVWGVVGWCVVGLAIGFSADLAYRYLPRRMSERQRAIWTAVVMGCVTFALTMVAVTTFYVPNSVPFSKTFPGLAAWALPWLIVNSGLGGYLAYALSRRV